MRHESRDLQSALNIIHFNSSKVGEGSDGSVYGRSVLLHVRLGRSARFTRTFRPFFADDPPVFRGRTALIDNYVKVKRRRCTPLSGFLEFFLAYAVSPLHFSSSVRDSGETEFAFD